MINIEHLKQNNAAIEVLERKYRPIFLNLRMMKVS